MPINRTKISSYKLVKTTANGSEDTAPTSFPVKTSGDIDLLDSDYGVSDMSEANNLEFLFKLSANNGTATILITGAGSNGPEERICSIAVNASTGPSDGGTEFWADSLTVTDYHLVTIADGDNAGGDHPAKVSMDVLGYRYINIYITATSGTTKVYARHF